MRQLNRQERRKQQRNLKKRMKHDKGISKCPLCGNLSKFFSEPTENWLCDVKCDDCGGTIKKDVSGLIPYVFIDITALAETGGADMRPPEAE